MGIKVLGPDINESHKGFAVNQKGEIRAGLGGLKGVGEAAVDNIVLERNKKGNFTSIFDLVKRVNQRSVNKKSLESLAYAGAFDCYPEIHRAQYFFTAEGDNSTGLEKIIRYGNIWQTNSTSNTNTLFGDLQVTHDIPPPRIPDCPQWSLTELLDHEKEVTGMFMSGHPLDHYRFEMRHYGITPVFEYNEFKEAIELHPNPFKNFRLACLVAGGQHRISKNGKKYGVLTLEDFSGKFDLTLFGDTYVKYANYFEPGNCLYITGKFEKWESRNEWNFRVAEICLLETIKRSLTRQVLIEVNPKLLNTKQIDFIERNVKRFPGKAGLKFNVIEPKEQLKVTMFMAEKGFEMNDEMAVFLNENQDLEVSVVTV